MKKLYFIILALTALTACSQTYQYSWSKHVVEGRHTGVVFASADNVKEAMGEVKDGVYTAPNGNVFSCGSTPAVAYELISVQPRMSEVKTVVGHCAKDMKSYSPQSPLSNWAVDEVMRRTEEITGRKVDIGIINFGGIRTSFAKGAITKDDVDSMFPFKNYLCYVRVSGKEVKAIFESFAKNRVEAVGGVRMVIKDRKLKSLEIGGESLDENRYYGIATIDFLLDGGDRLSLAKNAAELILTEEKLGTAILNYVIRTEAAGQVVDYNRDDRVIIEKN